MAKQPRTVSTPKNNPTSTYQATGAMATKPRSKATPTQEQIRARAYEIYLRRKGGPGDAMSDWKQAERELTAEVTQRL